MAVLIAVARADLIVDTAARVLRCLLSGVIAYAAVTVVWGVLRLIAWRDKS